MPCQYCGSADPQYRTCPHIEVCPTCRSKKHSLKYICPMLKEVMKQERDNKGYGYADHQEQAPKLSDRTIYVHVTLVVGLPTPRVNKTNHANQQNVHFDSKSPSGRCFHWTQQAVLGCNDIPKRMFSRDNQYQLPTRSSIDNQNPPEYGGTHPNQMPLTGKQYYLSHPSRRNGDNVSGDPPGNGSHYPYRPSGCGGPHGVLGCGYGGGSESSSSSYFEMM